MTKKNKIILISASILIFGMCIILYHFCKKTNDFWNIRFYEIISIFLSASLGLIGFAITSIFLERKNDKRRFIDAFVVLIRRANDLLNASSIIPNFQNQKEIASVKKRTTSNIKLFNNYISLFIRYKDTLKLSKEIDLICEQFNKYETIIDTCFENKKICDDTITKLDMCINMIKCKLVEMEIKLYEPK